MSQEQATSNNRPRNQRQPTVLSESYYGLLGLHPSASTREIRQAYRDLSKLYHPDTTTLPPAIATAKFQHLNEAYATLSNPERRTAYDLKVGYSAVPVVQPWPNLKQTNLKRTSERSRYSSSAYLDPTDRPLSPGELFALFILGLTFLMCLVLAITLGMTRGETLLKAAATTTPPMPPEPPTLQVTATPQPQPPTILVPASESPPTAFEPPSAAIALEIPPTIPSAIQTPAPAP